MAAALKVVQFTRINLEYDKLQTFKDAMASAKHKRAEAYSHPFILAQTATTFDPDASPAALESATIPQTDACHYRVHSF